MTQTDGRALRLFVLIVVIGGLVFPIVAGLWETLRAAFGKLPAIGAETWTLAHWDRLFALPGVATSVKLTLWTGSAATLLSLLLASAAAAAWHGRFANAGIVRVLGPFLAVPHAALAIGLAFLIAPSGWIVRLVSPWATGWTLPPDVATVHDPMGLALILGLTIKEAPFLLLVMLSALSQLPVRAQLAAGRALGYGPTMVWLKVILPQAYPLIRLPVLVVLSFSFSVVDMAIILGPSNPPVLSVAVTRWFFAPDTTLIPAAAAAALLQTGAVLAGCGGWFAGERLVAALGRLWVLRGGRGGSGDGRAVASATMVLVLGLGALSLTALLLWSFAWRWPFPLALPESWSLRGWAWTNGGWGGAFLNTSLIGLVTTAIALLLAICWLEGEDRGGWQRARWALGLIYLPLLVPQIAFLYGLSVVFLRLGLSGGMVAVVWAQSLFVFPYVMIALSDPWRALDQRHFRSAAALGAGPFRRLWAVKLPILLGPVLVAAAIGFAVSVAQYLPTLFLGAGRVATLTTEAVTLSSGSDRRVTGVYAVLQAALPLLAYAAALFLPAILHRNRRGLKGGAA
ncbi:MAG: ABC transporter permease subunit [Rhodobacteraceae bacterium]|nr:ABC transporter permease subunit [Paracoccaceae bacterium]